MKYLAMAMMAAITVVTLIGLAEAGTTTCWQNGNYTYCNGGGQQTTCWRNGAYRYCN